MLMALLSHKCLVEFNNLVYHITKHIKSACKGTKKWRIIRNFVPNYYDTLIISDNYGIYESF